MEYLSDFFRHTNTHNLSLEKEKNKTFWVSVVLFIPALISSDRAIWIETPNMAKAKLQHQELITNFRL